MNIRAWLGEHILQTHIAIFLTIQWGFNPFTLTSSMGTPVLTTVRVRSC